MNANERPSCGEGAVSYLWRNFRASDRLAVVLINKRTGSVIQRLASADRIVKADIQVWLRHHNQRRFEIYISMNALRPTAQGRTKADIESIRHLYLDFDQDGTARVESLLKREDLPQPNTLIASSPGKWQVIWNVEGFSKDQAEELQRSLARQTGADPAATDCSRVLRLPGFYNHKYAVPFYIRAEALSSEVFGREQFPKCVLDEGFARETTESPHLTRVRTPGAPISQSERDWAYAHRALARGDSPASVIQAIAAYRRFTKPDSHSYAERTVRKALQSRGTEILTPSELERT